MQRSSCRPEPKHLDATCDTRANPKDDRTIPPASPLFRELAMRTTDTIDVLKNGKPPKSFRVVEGHIPAELMEALLLNFTKDEVFEIAHRCDVYRAEKGQASPKALFLFGPPASGKTTMLNSRAAALFGQAENAVTIDGDIFRIVHHGFQMVALHGSRNRLIHKDAWEVMKKTGHMDQIKSEIVDHAIQNRQHVKVPDVATNRKRIKDFLSKLEAAGYEMHAICLWAPKSVTEARGRPRSVKDGKVFTTNSYASSIENTLYFGRLWEEQMGKGKINYKTVYFYDNTCHPTKLIDAAEFERLSTLTDEEAREHEANRKVMVGTGQRFEKNVSDRLGTRLFLRYWLDQRRGQAGFLSGVVFTLGCIALFRCVPWKRMSVRL